MKEGPNNNSVSEPNKIVKLIKSNKIISLLLLVIVAMLVYFLIRIDLLNKNYAQRTLILNKAYTVKIDSLRQKNLEQTINVFSWAVRSELNRDNLEEVNKFFLTFVKEYGIVSISLVDPTTKKIILFTDKKEEGEIFKEFNFTSVDEITQVQLNNSKTVVAPVMGLNRKTGVLLVRVNI